MLLLNLKISAERLRKAISSQENIVLLSDADMDGVASLLVLEEAIKSLGGKVALSYFPNREKQGYGLNEKAIARIKKLSPGLLILSDCGISSFSEVKAIKESNFDVIIIDHHEIIDDRIPDTPYIINPKQKSDPYPFKLMAGCGLCFRFVEVLLAGIMSKRFESNLLELVSLGTIADMMPEIEDNKDFIEKGIVALQDSERPGIRVFKEFYGNMLPLREYAQKIISAIQVADFKGVITECYILLTSKSYYRAKKLAGEMIKKSEIRRESMFKIVNSIISGTKSESLLVFEQQDDISSMLTGGIASRVCNKLNKPVFIISCKNKACRGSVRSPKSFNTVEALGACRDYLNTYGGHPQAAGFSLDIGNMQGFKSNLMDYASKQNN